MQLFPSLHNRNLNQRMKPIALILSLLLFISTSAAQKLLWGMSCSNGVANGTIFKTDSSGNGYTDVYTFNDPVNGIDPYGSLILAADGNLYGLTKNGGINNFGTIFKFDPAGFLYTKVHDFDSINGKNPFGSLVQASNGKLYGMTNSGGLYNRGVLFEFDIIANGFTKQIDFNMQNGAHPYGNLIEASDGLLYGLSSQGGGDATGALFQYDYTTGSIALKYSFILGPSNAGYDARGSLTQCTDGMLYGLSRFGEPGFESGGGVIFKFDVSANPWEAFSPLHTFDEVFPGFADGYELMGSLMQASNGKLYGMTQLGGNYLSGTIFEYDITSNTVYKLHDFNGITDGYRPYGSLMQAADGNLYGLTTSETGQAKMFQFDIASHTLTHKANVTGTPYYTALLETGNLSIGIPAIDPSVYVNIFPNPAGDYLNVDVSNGIRITKIAIIDCMGKVCKTDGENFKGINIEKLPGGMYHLKLFTGSQVFNRKFFKVPLGQ